MTSVVIWRFIEKKKKELYFNLIIIIFFLNDTIYHHKLCDRRIGHPWSRKLRPYHVNTFEQLCDLIVMEQFKNIRRIHERLEMGSCTAKVFSDFQKNLEMWEHRADPVRLTWCQDRGAQWLK